MKLQEQIKIARRQRNVSQKELAKYLGYTEAQICHFEKGNRKIKAEDLHKIEKYLDVNFSTFFDEPIFNKSKDKADKLFEIIKFLFATPNNYKEIDKIWYNPPTTHKQEFVKNKFNKC